MKRAQRDSESPLLRQFECLQARETVPVLFLQARSDERAFLVRDVLTLRGIQDGILPFSRRSRTEVRFASLSSQLARPEFRSLTGVREELFLFLRDDERLV